MAVIDAFCGLSKTLAIKNETICVATQKHLRAIRVSVAA